MTGKNNDASTKCVVYSDGQYHRETQEEVTKRLEKDLGFITVITGPRGSGKTLFMTFLGYEAILRGHKVWANYPISFDFMWPIDLGGITHYESLPLDMTALWSFDKELASGYILIDEINLWASSRRSMSVANRLLNSVLQLIRKRKLSFIFTCQNFKWLDSQLRWQTDLLVECRDQYFMRPHQLKPGEFINLTFKDMSGIKTGHPAMEYECEKNVRKWKFWGKPWWNCYNSWQEFDTMAASRKLRVLNDTQIIDMRKGHEYDVDGYDSATEKDKAAMLLDGIGQESITSEELQGYMASNGINLDAKHLGRVMKKVGWHYRQTGKGNVYEKLENT